MPGLKDVPRDERPPVWPVFFSFRVMVGIGFAMLGLGLWSLFLRWNGTLSTRIVWFLRAAMVMTPSGFGAVLFGWFTAEIGRQPYVVYGASAPRTPYRRSPPSAVTGSLIAFVVVYAFVFGFGSYYLAKLLRKGPEPIEDCRPRRPAARNRSGRFPCPTKGSKAAAGRRAQPVQ